MNHYVFPQTNSTDENFRREGGLTKLELVALLILTSHPNEPMIRYAFDRAEEFLNEARKRQGLSDDDREPLYPTRRFETP